MPTQPYILLFHVGNIAQTLNIKKMARRMFTLSAKISRDEGLSWFRGFVDLQHAPIAAQLGEIEESLALVISGIRAIGAGRILRERGDDIMSSHQDITVIWNNLPEQLKSDSETLIFFSALGPSLIELIESEAEPEEVLKRLSGWQEALESHRNDLRLLEKWQDIIGIMEIGLSHTSRYSNIRDRLITDQHQDACTQLALYMAVIAHRDASIEDNLVAQTMTLVFLLTNQEASRYMIQRFSGLVINYWKRVAGERAFLLNSPRFFKEEISRVPDSPTVKVATQVLLLAETAVGKRIDERFRPILISAAQVEVLIR